MGTEIIIESGLQVITRLIDRPSIEDLDNTLFFNKLNNIDVIEIKGTVTAGLHALLTKLIARCILPVKYNGLNINVIYINTENQFQVSKLVNIMHNEICDIDGPTNVDGLVKTLLNNLVIINCYNYHQFMLTLNSLDNLLLQNKKVGLIVVDSISAYYWQQKDELHYNSYLIKLINIIRKSTVQFKVATIYTKQFNFESKKETIDSHEGKKIVRYEICLMKDEKLNRFVCKIKSKKDIKELYYKIDKTGFVWCELENEKVSD